MIRAMGVEFRQAEVGRTVSLEQLEKEFAAIFIGIGLGSMERLNVPGEHATGVIDALSFIAHYKTSPDPHIGRTVVVIGGGNTAIDGANAARRLGAAEVHLFYRRTETEMPAFRFEYDHSKVEGVRFHWLSQPIAILERGGILTGVRFIRMALGDPDASGRRRPEPIRDSEFDFPCDMVIPALGQSRLPGLPVETKDGLIVVDRATGRTTHPKYYAGGDCVNGGREVVDAVADGKRAALAIAEALAHA
jgi:glutamate synthase (NADPH/NADH) small chain